MTTNKHTREAYSAGFDLALAVGKELSIDQLAKRHWEATISNDHLLRHGAYVEAAIQAGKMRAYGDLLDARREAVAR